MQVEEVTLHTEETSKQTNPNVNEKGAEEVTILFFTMSPTDLIIGVSLFCVICCGGLGLLWFYSNRQKWTKKDGITRAYLQKSVLSSSSPRGHMTVSPFFFFRIASY